MALTRGLVLIVSFAMAWGMLTGINLAVARRAFGLPWGPVSFTCSAIAALLETCILLALVDHWFARSRLTRRGQAPTFPPLPAVPPEPIGDRLADTAGPISTGSGAPRFAVALYLSRTGPVRTEWGRDQWLVGESVINGVLVVHFTCREVEAKQLSGLAEQLREGGPNNLLLNFSGVDFVSRSFFPSLLQLHQQVRAVGGRMAVCNLGAQVQKHFSLVHLDPVIEIYSDQQQALQTMMQRDGR
jgi:anti-anti-sigma factor